MFLSADFSAKQALKTLPGSKQKMGLWTGDGGEFSSYLCFSGVGEDKTDPSIIQLLLRVQLFSIIFEIVVHDISQPIYLWHVRAQKRTQSKTKNKQ